MSTQGAILGTVLIVAVFVAFVLPSLYHLATRRDRAARERVRMARERSANIARLERVLGLSDDPSPAMSAAGRYMARRVTR